MGRASRSPKVVPRFDRLEVRSLLSGEVAVAGNPAAMLRFVSPGDRLGRPEPAASAARPLLVAVVDSGISLDPLATAHYTGPTDFLDLADAYDAVAGTYGEAAVVDLAPGSPGTRSINNVARGIVDGIFAGGSRDVRIVPIRAFDPKLGFSPPHAVVNGIYHAVDIGAGVIEVGYVGDQFSLDPVQVGQFDGALAYARSKGVAVVVPAGNGFAELRASGVDIDKPGTHYHVYPADAHLGNMLVVASTDASGRLTSTSNWGAVRVDVGAASGPVGPDTAPSAGYVAGVAAVVAASRPDWSGSDVADRIKRTAEPVAALAGLVATGGQINAAGALRGIYGAEAIRPSDDYEGDAKSDLALYGDVPGIGHAFGEVASTRGFDPGRPITRNASGAGFGGPGSIPVPGRYYGGSTTVPAALIPQAGPDGKPTGKYDFAILGQDAQGRHFLNTFVAGAAEAGDVPVAGDFVGGGKDDLALYGIHNGRYGYKILTAATDYDPAKALYIDLNGTNFGGAGTAPVVGDFFGNGVDNLGIYGPEYTPDGRFTGRYAFGALDAGSLDANFHYTRAIYVTGFGGPGHLPIAGDFDGDGKDDVALHGRFFGKYGLADLLSSTGFNLDKFAYVNNNGSDLGGPGSVPVAGDFFGRGVAGPAVFGPEVGLDGQPTGSMTFTALDPGSIDARSRFTRSLTIRGFGGPGAIPASAPPVVRAHKAWGV